MINRGNHADMLMYLSLKILQLLQVTSARQESAPATLKITFRKSFVILQEQGKLETPIMTAAVD
jgi:hypothetical protein